MRPSQPYMSPRYWSEPIKPGIIRTPELSPCGIPIPRYTAEMRSDSQSMPSKASSHSGRDAVASNSSSRYLRRLAIEHHTGRFVLLYYQSPFSRLGKCESGGSPAAMRVYNAFIACGGQPDRQVVSP